MSKYSICFLLLFIHQPSKCFSQERLSINGINNYLSVSPDSTFNLPSYTLELWFNMQAKGLACSTGKSGIIAIPLITKGVAESDGNTRDMNYFLGIDSVTNTLVADFEEGNNQPYPGLNHPLHGRTSIAFNTWHHAALTYDGVNLILYLDGIMESKIVPGIAPQYLSQQHFAIGSALNSANTPFGFFNGVISDVRIWSYARSETQLHLTMDSVNVSAQKGLLALYTMQHELSAEITDHSGQNHNALLHGEPAYANTNPHYNLIFNDPPYQPLLQPADSAGTKTSSTILSAFIDDPDTGLLTVTYYLAEQIIPAAKPFTLIGLPDTQFYTSEIRGGSNAILKAQTEWIAMNRSAWNIVFTEGLGDCVQNGDNNGDSIEWMRCDTSMRVLENPRLTKLPQGIPYGMNVGNHDQSPRGKADGTTRFFNRYFGIEHFKNKKYYGGHYDSTNNSNYELFSAGGMDFIVVNFEFNNNRDSAEINWGHSILNKYKNRRAIIGSHYLINLDGSFGSQGKLLYESYKIYPSLFMMLCGHVHGESNRDDSFKGSTIHTVLSDYQDRTAGGNGWLRLYTFMPARNLIQVRTYSPWLNQWEDDADSKFTLSYSMSPGLTYHAVESVRVKPGRETTVQPLNLQPGKVYLWYVKVEDGLHVTTSETRSFHTLKK